MNNIKYIGTPLVVLFVAIAATIGFNTIARINFGSVMSVLLSRIPGINQFVESDYETGIYGIIQNDRAEMRSAVYNVDFLMSIYVSPTSEEARSYLDKEAKQYLAIYPYVVEAGIDLKEAKSETAGNQVVVDLPSPKVTLTDLDEKRGVTVIRDADVKPELVNMMKKTFEKRATDLAYEAGIIETAKKNAEKYFTNLFPKDTFKFKFADTPNLFDSVASNKTPIKFVYRNGALDKVAMFTQRHRKQQLDESKVYFNPADMFLKTNDGSSIGLYYNFFDKRTISETSENVKNYADIWLNSYWVKFYDCQSSEPKKIVANIYMNSLSIYFTVNGKQYCFQPEYRIESGQSIYGQSLYDVCGDLLYLAMSSVQQDLCNPMYEEYLRTYDDVISCIERDAVGSAKQKFKTLMELKRQNGDTKLNYAERDLHSLIVFMSDNDYISTEYDFFDNLLYSAYLFKNNDTEAMNHEFQQMFLENCGNFGIPVDDKNYIKEFFYNLPITTLQDKETYRKELINDGYYNDEIYKSLSATEFCEYLVKILKKYSPSIKVQDDRIDQLTIVGDFSNDKYNRKRIENILKEKLISYDKDNGVVVWCVSPDGKFFKDYAMVVFKKNWVYVLEENEYSETSVVSYFVPKKYYSSPYYQVQVNPKSGYFKISNYSNFNNAISSTLNEIQQRREGYYPQTHWRDKLAANLSFGIVIYCKRPDLSF
ncbi:MAG: DUF4230 domain-containing protein [Bacteroidales bacterium]|nr:DUF4230 domain-containing protein [Bacteroidales bacterium]